MNIYPTTPYTLLFWCSALATHALNLTPPLHIASTVLTWGAPTSVAVRCFTRAKAAAKWLRRTTTFFSCLFCTGQRLWGGRSDCRGRVACVVDAGKACRGCACVVEAGKACSKGAAGRGARKDKAAEAAAAEAAVPWGPWGAKRQ